MCYLLFKSQEYQSATLGYYYNTAIQSSTATVSHGSYHSVIANYHPVVELPGLVCDAVATTSGFG